MTNQRKFSVDRGVRQGDNISHIIEYNIQATILMTIFVQVTQRAMDCAMLGVSLRDRIPNEQLPQRSVIQEIVEREKIGIEAPQEVRDNHQLDGRMTKRTTQNRDDENIEGREWLHDDDELIVDGKIKILETENSRQNDGLTK